jgi:pilus assembly protein CpaE
VLLERLLTKAGDHLSLFTSPAVIDRVYEHDPAAYEAVLDAVRRMTPCVIVDLPHIWTPWVRQTLLTSDDIVVVAMPDLASLRNGKALVDLVRQNRPNDRPPHLVLNQVGQPKRPEIPVKDFATTIGIEPTLVLPFDPATYGAAANNAQMLMQIKPGSPTADGIMSLAEALTGRHGSKKDGAKNVLPLMSMLKGLKQA